MRSPVMVVFLVLLIAPGVAGAQETPETPPAAAAPGSAPAPVDAKARAPAKSRNFFGQAMAELTQSVEASRVSGVPARTTPAKAPTPTAVTVAPPPRDTQVAAQDPVD